MRIRGPRVNNPITAAPCTGPLSGAFAFSYSSLIELIEPRDPPPTPPRSRRACPDSLPCACALLRLFVFGPIAGSRGHPGFPSPLAVSSDPSGSNRVLAGSLSGPSGWFTTPGFLCVTYWWASFSDVCLLGGSHPATCVIYWGTTASDMLLFRGSHSTAPLVSTVLGGNLPLSPFLSLSFPSAQVASLSALLTWRGAEMASILGCSWEMTFMQEVLLTTSGHRFKVKPEGTVGSGPPFPSLKAESPRVPASFRCSDTLAV